MAAAFNLPMISYVSFSRGHFPGTIFFILVFFCSFVQIKKLHIKKTFQHLQELVHPTHKSQNQLFHYCLHTIGLKLHFFTWTQMKIVMELLLKQLLQHWKNLGWKLEMFWPGILIIIMDIQKILLKIWLKGLLWTREVSCVKSIRKLFI